MTTLSPTNTSAVPQRSAYVIGVGRAGRDGDARADHVVATSRGGVWAAFFGDIELPADEALDALAAWAETWTEPPSRITIAGEPHACLLVVLWLRTIWLAGTDCRIALDWREVHPPDGALEGRDVLAARACAEIVDEVR